LRLPPKFRFRVNAALSPRTLSAPALDDEQSPVTVWGRSPFARFAGGAGASSVGRIWLVLWLFARDTRPMKVQATILISYRADSFGEAGGAIDDVLQRAREREDVEIDSIQLGTPASAGPVTLPYVERPPAPPQRVPHPLPNGDRA
jgi:hypothetical protein